MSCDTNVVTVEDLSFLLMPSYKGYNKSKHLYENSKKAISLYGDEICLSLESYIVALAVGAVPNRTKLMCNGMTPTMMSYIKNNRDKLNVFKKAFLNDLFVSLEVHYGIPELSRIKINVITDNKVDAVKHLDQYKTIVKREMDTYRKSTLLSTSSEFRNFMFMLKTPLSLDCEVNDTLALMYALSCDKDKDDFYNYM